MRQNMSRIINHLETSKRKQTLNQNPPRNEKGKEEINCLFCRRTFFDIKKLQVHIKTKHNFKTDCLFCGRKNKSVGAMHNHIVAEHSKIQATNEKMTAHMKKDTKSCQTVEKSNGEPQIEQTKVKSFNCNKCDWTFQSSNNLTEHMEKRHTEISHLNCSICQMNLSSETDLQRHIKNSHEAKQEDSRRLKTRMYFCPNCEYQFTSLSDLREHKRYRHNFA